MNNKLNVCLMNDSFPPVIDGVANTVVNYATIIQQRFGNAIVVTPQYPNATDKYNFPVLRYRSFNTTKLVGYRAGYPFSVSMLQKLKTSNIDIIHSHCPVVSTLLARTLRETTNMPIVFTYHTKFNIDISNKITSKNLQKSVIKLLLNNIESCDEVWVVSNGAGENLRSIGYKGDFVIMQNGVDFPKGRVADLEVAELRRSLSLPENIPVFLFVGRMMWYKGIRLILDGLKKIKDGGVSYKMVFVGEGEDKSEIEDYAKKLDLESDCVFAGRVDDREQLRAYYCLADLFLFPSMYDTNGIVVREAAACALPSLLISGSSAAEGIEDWYTGILIDENPETMATALLNACNNRTRLKEIGQNAMEKIYFSWEDSVEKAYARYGIVLENFKKGQHPPIKYDEFFSVMAEILRGLEKVRTVHIKKRNSREQ